MKKFLFLLLTIACCLLPVASPAGVLSFNGTSGTIKFSTLQTALQNVSNGAWTMCALFKRGGTGTYDAVSYLQSSDTTTRAGVSIKDTSELIVDVGAGSTDGNTYTNTTSPYLMCITKASGAGQTPRTHWKLGSGGAWTHVNFGTSLGTGNAAANRLEIGTWLGSDFFNGHIGLVGWWVNVMSDANVEALDDNWRTSDWYNSAHGTPAFLAELNVAAASVVDLIGNASSITTAGTSLDSGETLNSWNFNGTGSAPPAAPPTRALLGVGK